MKNVIFLALILFGLSNCKTYRFKNDIITDDKSTFYIDLSDCRTYVCRFEAEGYIPPNEKDSIPYFRNVPTSECSLNNNESDIIEEIYIIKKNDTCIYLTTKKNAELKCNSSNIYIDDINKIYIGKIDANLIRFTDPEKNAYFYWEIKTPIDINKEFDTVYIKSIPQIVKGKPTTLTIPIENVFQDPVAFYLTTEKRNFIYRDRLIDWDFGFKLNPKPGLYLNRASQNIEYDRFFTSRKILLENKRRDSKIKFDRKFIGFGTGYEINGKYYNQYFKKNQLKYVPHNTENWKYFRDYVGQGKTDTIKEHWEQYFQEDICGSLNGPKDMFSVKFDSYGALYPEEYLFKNFEEENFKRPKLNNKKPDAYSLYNIFSRNKSGIEENQKSGDYKEFTDLAKRKIRKKHYTKKNEIFYLKWNALHDPLILDSLKKKAEGKEKILFFVHGYNVPYSLANIQAIELFKLMEEDPQIDMSSTLFVPVFWPSNNMKKCNIDNEDEFDISDITKFKNGTDFFHYTTRAYFAGIGLRRLLNLIENDEELKEKELYIFSHSMGAVVVTTALINTVHNLPHSQHVYNKIDEYGFDELSDEKKKLISDRIHREILEALRNEPVPTSEIKVFISAGAVSGKETFRDSDKSEIGNKHFFVTYNPDDRTLSKTFRPFEFISVRIGKKYRFSTSLGVSNKNDSLIRSAFGEYAENFKRKTVETKGEHNIFNYMGDPQYKMFIREWYNYKYVE